MSQFTTVTDANTFVGNSGVDSWDWGDTASADGFASWLWQNDRDSDPSSPVHGLGSDDYDEQEAALNSCLRAYLNECGADIAAFGL